MFIATQNVYVLCLNETKLDGSITDSYVKIKDYRIFRKDRNRRGVGGVGWGVAIYVRDAMNVMFRSDLASDAIEAIPVEIRKPNSKPFIITASYRPPAADDNFLEELECLIASIDSQDKEYILMGDLNCNKLSEHPDRSTLQLNRICELYQLRQVIESATRITENTETLIAVIITSDSPKILSSGVLHVGMSDHSLVYAIRKVTIPNRQGKLRYVTSRQFKNFDPDEFRNDVKLMPGDKISSICNPNDKWKCWKQMFDTVANRHAPLRTRRVKNKDSPWLTSQIRKLIIERTLAKKTAIKSRDPEHWKLYRCLRNNVNNVIRTAKSDYCTRRIEANGKNPKPV